MRVDDFLSSVGLIKRRTIAKELGSSGLIEVNGRRVKPGYQVSAGDIVRIRGSHPCSAEILALPSGSVPKDRRDMYFRPIVNPAGQ